MATVVERSKRDWSSSDTIEHLQFGCMQRIADACELMAEGHLTMAKSYRELIEERDRYARLFRAQQDEIYRLSRRCAALQGWVTRLKRQNRG